MKLQHGRRFSALLAPGAIHCVELRGGRRGLRAHSYTREPHPPSEPAAAVRRLATVLEAAGARDARVAVAIAGYGVSHHIVALPPAPPEVLRPVIARELRRFYPDLFAAGLADPVLDAVPLSELLAGDTPGPRDHLAAAAPRALVEQLHAELTQRQMRLEHVTAAPEALRRLHGDRPERATEALLLMVPGGPLLGFFHGGTLRLFAEPVPNGSTRAEVALDSVAEQVERGALFLRQQFRGATLDRVLLAAEPRHAAELERGLGERLGVPIEPAPLYPHAPGTLAGLGAALDAASAAPLRLLPEPLRPVPRQVRGARALAAASALLLVLLAGWWALAGVLDARAAEQRLRAVEDELRARAPEWQQLRSVVERRQQHARRLVLAQGLGGGREMLPALLWTLQDAPPPIRVQEVRAQRQEHGWSGTIEGLSVAASGASAAAGVRSLLASLRQQTPGGSFELARFESATSEAGEALLDAGGAIAISFQISFIVSSMETRDP